MVDEELKRNVIKDVTLLKLVGFVAKNQKIFWTVWAKRAKIDYDYVSGAAMMISHPGAAMAISP